MVDIHLSPIVAFRMYTEWPSLVQFVGFAFIFTSVSQVVWGRRPYFGWNLERINLRVDEIEVTNIQLLYDIANALLELVDPIGEN